MTASETVSQSDPTQAGVAARETSTTSDGETPSKSAPVKPATGGANAMVPSDVLMRSAEEAVRRICLSFLDEARDGLKRLDDEEDLEALHDFRVGVRRLRSATRAWKACLASAVTPKDRAKMKALQQATNRGRDAEVLIAWLEAQRGHMNASHRVGVDWLLTRLRTRKDRVYARARVSVRRDFKSFDKKLRKRLRHMEVEVDLYANVEPETFAQALADRLREQAEETRALLAQVAGIDEVEIAHDARIAVKRLRYLIEPLKRQMPEVRHALKSLKQVQQILGEVQDTSVLNEELGEAIEKAAARRARILHEMMVEADDQGLRREQRRAEHTGLFELARRARLRMEGLFSDFHGWRDAEFDAFFTELEELARTFEGRGGVEIERKFLLRALPEVCGEVMPIEIEQGYLPGSQLQERLRKKVSQDGHAKYIRTVKTGAGIARRELEEATDAAFFAAAWPFTEGKRVTKCRYPVAHGDRVWEIDRFTDRELVLAEIEMRHADEKVELPEWLAPLVVEEVTGDPAYLNINLAR